VAALRNAVAPVTVCLMHVKKTCLTVPGFYRILFRIGQTSSKQSPLQIERRNPVYISLKASPQAVFLVFSGLFLCPECGGKTYLLVSDVTPDPKFDQLSQQAHIGIQALCLTDICAFTGGATWFHNARVLLLIEAFSCLSHPQKSR
jgi:hypothetical protein